MMLSDGVWWFVMFHDGQWGLMVLNGGWWWSWGWLPKITNHWVMEPTIIHKNIAMAMSVVHPRRLLARFNSCLVLCSGRILGIEPNSIAGGPAWNVGDSELVLSDEFLRMCSFALSIIIRHRPSLDKPYCQAITTMNQAFLSISKHL